jgi:hypothetical protein
VGFVTLSVDFKVKKKAHGEQTLALFKTIIKPIVTYASETWVLTKKK